MKKTLECIFLFVILINTANATWTRVWNLGHPAQCNNWGWVKGNVYTSWQNTCTPLQVKYDNYIIQVDSTPVCDNDLLATYQIEYNRSKSRYELIFMGCLQP